jgi:hypothetical protein
MDEAAFRQKLYHANVMQEIHNHDYWLGYAEGLQRAFYGEVFNTEEDHERWLSLLDSKDLHEQERGVGYRHGLRVA